MRHPLIIGNWKLNGSCYMVNELIKNLRKKLDNISGCTVAVAPPSIYLNIAQYAISNSQIFLSAQNVDINLFGAFTGEISVKMLKDIGVKYTIIGHSERRIYHKESDELIAKKFFILKKYNLIPVLCIGETEKEKENGKTEEICVRQINIILKNYGVEIFNNSVIAYEPIWAIGTGKSANPELVQEIHKFIREYIAKFNVQISENITIQYGGSVNFHNAEKLFSQSDIDGALVGSASLEADEFSKIVKIASLIKNKEKSI